MHARHAAIALGLIVAAFVGGRWSASDSGPTDLAGSTVDAFQRAIESALAEPDSTTRWRRLASALDAASAGNVAGALRAVEIHHATIRDPEFDMIVQIWTEVAPESAAREVIGWEQQHAARAIPVVIDQLARTSPPDAKALIDQLPPGLEYLEEELMMRLVRTWAERPDLTDATAMVAAMPYGPLKQQLTATIARARLAQAGPDGVKAWAEAVGRGSFRKVAYRKTAMVLARHDPRIAAEWVDGHGSGDFTEDTIRIVTSIWIELDPESAESALAWSLSKPPGEGRDYGVRHGFGSWLSSRPNAALAWLERVPRDTSVEHAYDVYARHLAKSDPSKALSWVDRIEDQRRHDAALGAVVTSWLQSDRVAATEWLETSGYSQEEIRNMKRTRRLPRRLERSGG